MSNRAKEAALKACPVVIEEHTERDINKSKRLFYIKGYEQAEKELALTWEDVKSLDKLTSIVEDENFQDERRGRELRYDGDEKFYSEVLRRFNEQREKK